MQVIYQRACGIDVHKKSIVVCVLLTQEDATVQRHVRSFGTMTADLLACVDWLESLQVQMVAMESTGVFWRPLFNLLEAHLPVMLVNAQHMKAVPGRKTDVKDSEWIADLLRHGLLTASFIPPEPIRDLRDLTRYRKTLMQERAQEVNRLQKVLETANLKLASVASDVMGKSGRDMLDALVGGERDPQVLAELARGRLRQKLPQLRLALDGRLRPHQTFLLQQLRPRARLRRRRAGGQSERRRVPGYPGRRRFLRDNRLQRDHQQLGCPHFSASVPHEPIVRPRIEPRVE